MHTEVISLAGTIALTERSRSTWWRRITLGEVQRGPDDAGGRAMLHLHDVAPHICIPMTSADIAVVLQADAGDAHAQNDIGQMLSIAGKHKSALYWLLLSAAQDFPDAMQWLGQCYLRGDAVAMNENLGIMWIAKAAAHGHVIANDQMNWLRAAR